MIGSRPALPPSRRAFLVGALAAAAMPRHLRAQTNEAPMRIRCSFSDQEFFVTLQDSTTTRDFLTMLPLDLTIEDYSTNEKIAHLPRRLDEGGLTDYDDEATGDLCYFTGWGNLAFFHGGYSYRGDLIRLGRLEGGVDPLLVKGRFPLRIELA